MQLGLLFDLKDVHCSTIFFAHRAQNLGEASPLVVISRQGLQCAIKYEHLLMMLCSNIFFAPKQYDTD